jgi:hypothetical protein
MRRRSPLLLALALLFGGCQALTAPPVAELGEPFWLGYREVVVVPTSAGTLRFAELLEDSRCPSDPLIHCAWAGRVRLRMTAAGFGSSETVHELRLLDEPGAIMVGGYRVSLVAVDPPRTIADPPPESRYRAQLVITAVR